MSSVQQNKGTFINNITWIMAGKIINMILQFVVSLATARYLGPSNLGTINYVAAYVSFFSAISSLGLNVIVIKDISTGKNDENEVVWTAISMRFITGVLSSISVIILLFWLSAGDKEIITIAFLESLSIIFSSLDTIGHWFQAKLLSKYVTIAGIIAYICMSLYRVYLLIIEANIYLFAFATTIDMIASTLLMLIFFIKCQKFKFKFNFKLGREMLTQSYHFMIAGLITIVYSQIDKVMLGDMLDKKAVGLYSATLTISTLWSMIPSALIQSLTPVLYEAGSKSRMLFLKRLKQSYAIVLWLGICYSIFVTIFSKLILNILYGSEYVEAKGALIIVVWYYGVASISTLNQIYLSNDKKNKYINYFCIGGLVVNVLLNWLLIPRYEIIGAAVATLVTHIVIQIMMPLMFKETREMGILILNGLALSHVIGEDEKNILRKLTKPK